MFTRFSGSSFLALLVYVDDIIAATNDIVAMGPLKTASGSMKFFLGLEVAYSTSGISVCQRKYDLGFVENFGYLGCRLISAPLEPNLKLSQSDRNLLVDPTNYRLLIGKLIYLTITRPNFT